MWLLEAEMRGDEREEENGKGGLLIFNGGLVGRGRRIVVLRWGFFKVITCWAVVVSICLWWCFEFGCGFIWSKYGREKMVHYGGRCVKNEGMLRKGVVKLFVHGGFSFGGRIRVAIERMSWVGDVESVEDFGSEFVSSAEVLFKIWKENLRGWFKMRERKMIFVWWRV